MSKAAKDIIFFGLMGLMVGLLPAMLAAGAWMTWRYGGDITQIDMFTYWNLSPFKDGTWGEPFQTGSYIGLGVLAVFTIGSGILGYRPQLTSHGSARWAREDELRRDKMTAQFKDVKGPIVAKLGKPKRSASFLSSTDIPHYLIAAPTGAGKGVGIVIPTLLTYTGSVICLDVKGENFELTSRRRQELGDRIFKFSPYDSDGRTHRYNPLDIISEAPARRRYTEARRLASNLIIAKSKSAEGFLEGAREIFAATVVYAIEQKKPTIGGVLDLLSQEGEAHQNFARMSEKAKASESISLFNRMAAISDLTISEVTQLPFTSLSHQTTLILCHH